MTEIYLSQMNPYPTFYSCKYNYLFENQSPTIGRTKMELSTLLTTKKPAPAGFNFSICLNDDAHDVYGAFYAYDV